MNKVLLSALCISSVLALPGCWCSKEDHTTPPVAEQTVPVEQASAKTEATAPEAAKPAEATASQAEKPAEAPATTSEVPAKM